MGQINLLAWLEEHFSEAGFIGATSLMADIDCRVPEKILVMHNGYALIVVYDLSSVDTNNGISLSQTKDKMHDYIRKALLALENQKGLIVDAYLLLGLASEPDDATIAGEVRTIEMDTKVCRKHIVWPSKDGDGLDRLQFITVLSLPKPLDSHSINAAPFELSANAKALLSEYKKLGNLDGLMTSIKDGVWNANQST